MNRDLIILGLIEIISALTIGIFLLALTFKIVQWVGRKYYDVKDYNLSYSIFTAAIIISVGIMAQSVLQPLLSSFRLLNFEDNSFYLAFKFISTGAVYIGLAYSISILIGLVSTYLYSKLTVINEFVEIKENNVGVALIIGSIIITLSLLTKSGVELLIEAFIPYPENPSLD